MNFAVFKPLDFIGENPEAPPVADKARDLSEQIQSDATRSKRAARQYLRGENTGTPFFKTAPNFDFYFFGGYFLVCAIIIAQIAEQRFLLSRKAAPVFSDAAPIPGSSGFDIHAALFSKPQDLLLFPFELRKIELRFIVYVDPVLDRQNCVEEVAVENGAVLRNLLRRLRGNQTFIPQTVNVFFY